MVLEKSKDGLLTALYPRWEVSQGFTGSTLKGTDRWYFCPPTPRHIAPIGAHASTAWGFIESWILSTFQQKEQFQKQPWMKKNWIEKTINPISGSDRYSNYKQKYSICPKKDFDLTCTTQRVCISRLNSLRRHSSTLKTFFWDVSVGASVVVSLC